MNHLFRILLLGSAPPGSLSRYPGVSAGTGYPDTTFSRTFLVHLRKKPGIFCAGNWEPQTLTRIKSGPWRTPRKSPCYATCTNFSAPRKTENRSRSMNSRTSHSGNGSPPTRKSSECLPYPGQPANKPYPYFTASGTRTIKRSAPLKPAWLWGQGLPQMSSLLKNACPNSILPGILLPIRMPSPGGHDAAVGMGHRFPWQREPGRPVLGPAVHREKTDPSRTGWK